MKICLDYGHCLSGADTGAQGCGQREEVMTRLVGRKVREILKQHNVQVIETVYNNTFSSVEESLRYRWTVANNAKVDLFISIHFNCSNGQGHGTEVYTHNANHFKQAEQVLNNIVKLGFNNRGIKDGSGLAVIRHTEMTAMLVECCFIDNREDMGIFNANKMAESIAAALIGDENINSNAKPQESTIAPIPMQKPEVSHEKDNKQAIIDAVYSIACSLNDYASKHRDNQIILYDIKALNDIMAHLKNN